MPKLTVPHVRFRTSFVAAMKEFEAEGRGLPEDESGIGYEIREWRERWPAPAEFARYVARLIGDADESRPPSRPGWVHCTTLWYAEGDEYLGRIAVRHRLTPYLLELGGHIGYDVRASARRRGHATAMLREALPYARGLGLDRVLVTCDVTNTGSRRVIEAGGGEFEDRRGEKLRYWIRTGD
ncbi:GNAT family N-acetyltransferase [Streptomyces sp. NPDC047082]|uniref:GNAT family N-acetyltransferase n=1 Tax=Streptomyces sp. NPDC047082 TaxID=3155259 RepID=UPI0033F21E04